MTSDEILALHGWYLRATFLPAKVRDARLSRLERLYVETLPARKP